MQFLKILAAISYLVIVGSEKYTEDNATLIFDFYKEKYHKSYSKAAEKEAYTNFVNNLNKVTLLNMNPNETNVLYTLNKYADLDSAEVEEHYAVNISTYDTHELYKGPVLHDRNVLSTMTEPTTELVDMENLDLYDLDDSKNLFEQYVKAFKKNYTKKYDRTVHFYKFVKALVNANRENYEGNTPLELDENSDVIEHPTEYYY